MKGAFQSQHANETGKGITERLMIDVAETLNRAPNKYWDTQKNKNKNKKQCKHEKEKMARVANINKLKCKLICYSITSQQKQPRHLFDVSHTVVYETPCDKVRSLCLGDKMNMKIALKVHSPG